VVDWVERLTDLSGPVDPWKDLQRNQDNALLIMDRLTEGYKQLTTEQAIALSKKYQAQYFVTYAPGNLDFPVSYQNSKYVLYQSPSGQ